IIVQPPDVLLPPDLADNPPPPEWLLVAIGYDPEQVSQWVKPGDLVAFDSTPLRMGENLLSGHSLDDRASIAAVTVCLSELQHVQHAWDVIAAATVQEEETFGGAYTSSFAVMPDIAVAIDVTFAKSPGVSDYNTFPLGKGVALGFGPNIHPAIFNAFKELCIKLDIPYHTDVMPAHSGTDAYALQVAAEGIPTMVLSIPLRYMHTPVETIDLRDVQRAGHLLAEFIGNLKSDFIGTITWDK
ncbi:MAG: M42 family peptidase, partial [Anaerolineae bacterium]|nr:M42 family peptidase [Anaerolineae bacterium]